MGRIKCSDEWGRGRGGGGGGIGVVGIHGVNDAVDWNIKIYMC